MAGFILGVVSSLAATALTVTAGWLGSSRMQHLPMLLLSRITGLGIQRIYSQQKTANAYLGADLASARWVRVLAGRGNELTRESFHSVWKEADTRLEWVQVLLPDPRPGTASCLADRENEIRRCDAGYEPGLLARQVEANVQYVMAVAGKRERVALRLFDAPNICRIIVTDRVAYLTTYIATDHGRNSPCIVFSRPGPMYEFALRIFLTTWDRAIPASTGEVIDR